MRFVMGVGVAGVLALSSPAFALDKVTFATNWLAEAEHGGYYQAVVDGTYAKYGLDVTILQGGPQANNGLLLAAGRIQFYMGGNMLLGFSAVAQKLPIIIVAADFQKDPQIMMSHPGVGLDKWTDLPKATAFVGKEGLVSFYSWMKTAYGFKDENVKPYNFNSAPFIADKNSIQQGYLTAEPYAVGHARGPHPPIFTAPGVIKPPLGCSAPKTRESWLDNTTPPTNGRFSARGRRPFRPHRVRPSD